MFENIVGFISGILQQLQQFWQEYKIGEQIVNGIQYVDGIMQGYIPHSYLRIGIVVVLILIIVGALFRGRKGNERIVYKAHPCVMRTHPFLFIVGLAGCVIGLFGIGNQDSIPFYSAGVLGGLILLVLWLQSLRKTLSVSNERIMLRVGILARDIREIYHTDIRWVHLKQGIPERLFSVGEIEVASAGTSGVEIAIAGIPNPAKAKRIIDQKRREEKEQHRVTAG